MHCVAISHVLGLISEYISDCSRVRLRAPHRGTGNDYVGVLLCAMRFDEEHDPAPGLVADSDADDSDVLLAVRRIS